MIAQSSAQSAHKVCPKLGFDKEHKYLHISPLRSRGLCAGYFVQTFGLCAELCAAPTMGGM